MRSSLRRRMMLWYAAVSGLGFLAFAVVMYERVLAHKMREIDGGLLASAQYLDVVLRRFPPSEFDNILSGGTSTPKQRPNGIRPDNIAIVEDVLIVTSDSPTTSTSTPNPPTRRTPTTPPGATTQPATAPRGERTPPREVLLDELTLPAMPRGHHPLPPPHLRDQRYFIIWRRDGSVLKSSGEPELRDRKPFADVDDPPRFFHRPRGREVAMLGPFHSQILVGKLIDHEMRDVHGFALQISLVGLLLLGMATVGGYMVSGRIVGPIRHISETAAHLSRHTLGERIHLEQVDDELRSLAETLNATFDRLQAAIEQQARFTADASHELRTPLAILQSQSELILSKPRTAEEYRSAIEACLRATRRMTALVEGLLTLSKVDAGQHLDLADRVPWHEVVTSTVESLQPLAQKRGVRLHVQADPAVVTGNAPLLGQLVSNLVSNAILYNRAAGEVRVALRLRNQQAVLTVADTGQGIPEADRPHIFERFYRVDKSRSQKAEGYGLGLAICQSILTLHHGTIAFHSETDVGTTFTVTLPQKNIDGERGQ